MVRSAIESLYIGSCDIYKYRTTTNPKNKREETADVPVYTGMPCRLSIQNSPAASEGETSGITQTIKLFLSPEIIVEPGSKIAVTQHGRTAWYRNSGVPAVYSVHQEIILELMKRRA